MTENSRFFDSASYTEAQFNQVLARIMEKNGYVAGLGSELAVIQHNPAGMSVDVGTGEAWINGAWYENTVALQKTIAAADPTNPRIDRVVLRLSWSANSIILAILQGTPAGSPTAPALTQNSSTWELSLAQVLVGAGVTSILTANITDERGTQCGIAAAELGVMHIELTGELDAASKKIINLADPVDNQDADTKAARNAAIAALAVLPSPTGSAYKIPTVNTGGTAYELVPCVILASASDTLQKSDDTSGSTTSASYVLCKTIVVPPNHKSRGVYRVKATISVSYADGYDGTAGAYKIYVDGVAAGAEHAVGNGGSGTYSDDLTIVVSASAQIQLYCKFTNGGAGGQTTYSNFRVYCTQTAVSPSVW